MTPKVKKWSFYPVTHCDVKSLSYETSIHPIVCQILLNRGLKSPDEIYGFLNPDLQQIHDPFLLKDMAPIVERITNAIEKGERILIFGDYDVDGITASAVLNEFLKKHGAKIQVRLPNRLQDGYGLTEKTIRDAALSGIDVLITVDCGISDHKAAEYASLEGIDLIITDHHHPPLHLPKAFGIINPKQSTCNYPYKDLAGVGVALKVIQALTLYWQGNRLSLNQKNFWSPVLNEYLDLVCLGTIADIMPLTGENRVLVKFGLDALNNTKRPGLIALKDSADVLDKKMTTGLVAFSLAPRINATGRIRGPEEGFRLICTHSHEEAKKLSHFLNIQNQKRRQIEEKILAEAIKKIEQEKNAEERMIIVLSDKGWHPGVIGIVAQKLVERFFLPTVIIAIQSGFGKGSARSIPQIHLYELLKQCEDLLKDFGGHAAAAGLTIEEKNIDEFRLFADKILKERFIREDLIPEIKIDKEIIRANIEDSFINQLESLNPFGCGNPEPTLCLKGLYLAAPPRLLKDAHVKLSLKHGPYIYDAIGFNMKSVWEDMASAPADQRWDIAFCPQINTWKGRSHVQLRLKDVKVHDTY